MRTIRYIAIHCTGGNQKQKAADVVYYHTGPEEKGCLGWKAPGYHYIIEADGTIVNTWPEDKLSNGVKGFNTTTINVCWVGGIDLSNPKRPGIDNRTEAQKKSLRKLIIELKGKYPSAEILGHRDFPNVNKECPSFDVKKEYSDI